METKRPSNLPLATLSSKCDAESKIAPQVFTFHSPCFFAEARILQNPQCIPKQEVDIFLGDGKGVQNCYDLTSVVRDGFFK